MTQGNKQISNMLKYFVYCPQLIIKYSVDYYETKHGKQERKSQTCVGWKFEILKSIITHKDGSIVDAAHDWARK